MTGAVIDFSKAKLEREAHWAGEVRCVGCQHEWAAVAPLGTFQLDCPQCGFNKGVPMYPFSAEEGDQMFTCNCGCQALAACVTINGFKLMCIACAANQTDAVMGCV